ncbi:MAG: hypothetical protein SV765_10545 [Pseudomonadota bacterium]|nr:hypothetical protein [Pseudomonadota bacterium]
MIISHKYRFIFVKTRKTAGSTFEQLVSPYLGCEDICTGSTRDGTPPLNCAPDQNGHLPAASIKQHLVSPLVWEQYFKFTVERNPWDKVVSSFFWHRKIKPQFFADMPFEEYVCTCQLLPRDWPLYTEQNQLLVDKVFAYEDLPSFYKEFNQRFGTDISLQLLQTTRLKSGIRTVTDYHDLHTDKTREFVARTFAPEIALMGYEY